jgi:hypothetical protein
VDRTPLSEAIVQELADIFADALRRAAPALIETDMDGIERGVQELARRVMGPVVEQVVATIAAADAMAEAPRCDGCHAPMRLVDAARSRALQGLVGEYQLRRACFVCDGCHRGVVPVDARLGIGPGALSPGLARVACRAGIDDPFGEGTSGLQETLGITVPAEAIRRITEGIGAVAEAEQQADVARVQHGDEPVSAAAIVVDGPTLVVEVDGAQVHLDDAWHEVKVGMVAQLGPATWTDPKSERTVLRQGTPTYCAGFEPAELFWYRVYASACQHGLGTLAVTLVVVLGDGADWIWRYAPRFLAVGRVELVEIVDIYHAWEHLWTIANAVFGAGTLAATRWVEPLKQRLVADGVEPILEALRQLAPDEEAAAEEVRKALGYFTTHAARMDYPSFVARHLPIGSGAVESACKTLIQAREKRAGMRWSRPGAQHVATLRALYRSGRWGAFWQTHPQRRRPAVFPRRHPAEPDKLAA